MITQKEYWNKKISEWSSASYGQHLYNPSLVEKIATYFRSVNTRKKVALALIAPISKGKIILDLGCGLGDLCFELLKYSPKKVIGIDISEVAINIAKNKAKKLKIEKEIEFRIGDTSTIVELPTVDIVVGLGFIDYLNKQQLKHLFMLIDHKKYLFSFFEKKFSLLNILHAIYIKIQGCPGAYKYTKDEIKKIIPSTTKPLIISKNGLVFITNIKNTKDLDWKNVL